MVWENSDIINAITTLLLLIAVGVSLFIGLRSLSQTRNIHSKELKTRLLGVITDWVSEIEATSLNTSIPSGSDRQAIRTAEINILREYGIPYARKEHIRAVASFNKVLQDDINELIINLGVYMCLRAMSLQVDGKEAFPSGGIRSTVDELEEKISEGKANINDLQDEYTVLVTNSANKVFIKVAELTTELLKS